jgi:hypothetical protein
MVEGFAGDTEDRAVVMSNMLDLCEERWNGCE